MYKIATNPVSWVFFFLFLAACSSPKGNKTPLETPTMGRINISVDETFKPVIDSQIKVFESSFPDIQIIPHYKAEAECLRDLAGDSTRMVIVTRGLTTEESKFYMDSLSYKPSYMLLAFDAVSVIVNKAAKDSIFTVEDLRAILNGTSKKALQPVMDGVTATSTVRYAIDSILKGAPLGKNVVAAKSSEDVISYVASHENAIGFVGVEWIGNPEDASMESFIQNITVASIKCGNCLGETYVKPYQANIATRRYPLVRGLYYILKENFSGVGNNFANNFLIYERGQLIFSRAYLWPAKMSFQIRNMQINN